MKKWMTRLMVLCLALLVMVMPLSAMAETTLRFSWWGGDARHEATLKVIELYESQNPGVKIEAEYGGFSGYLEKMVTQMSGNAAPDIMQIDYAFLEPFWGQMDNFVDFNQDTIVDKSGISADMLKGVSAPTGQLIGLPTGLNFSVIYANKKLADAAGIDLTQPLTWARAEEICAQLKAYDPEAYMFWGGVNRYIFEPFMFNLTGKPLVSEDYELGFDREAALAAFTQVQKFYEIGASVPMENIASGAVPYESTEWLNDKLLFILDFSSGEASAKATKEPGQVVAIPPLGDPEAANTGIVLRPTNMLAVNAKSANAEEALKFVNFFFNNEEAIDILELVRSVPSTEKALTRMTEQGKLQADTKAVADWAMAHKGGAGQNIISTNVALETIEGDVLSALYYGDLTAEQAADEFVTLMSEKVAELKAAAGK